MGNTCPSGFQLSPVTPGQCVVRCPSDKGYKLQVTQRGPTCVYNNLPDPGTDVVLNPVPSIRIQQGQSIPTLDEIRRQSPSLYNQFIEEQERANGAIEVAYGAIDKQKKINDAFIKLQKAENVRHKAPDAYQAARIEYYTLTEGEKWLDEEKQRLAEAEADPTAMEYKKEFEDKLLLVEQQGKTIDVVNGLKNRVLSIRDELGYSVNAFRKQIDELRSQILIERKKAEMKERSAYDWLNLVLNMVLVVVLLFTVFTLFRKFQQYRLRTTTISNAPPM
jgi:hypothetical protein